MVDVESVMILSMAAAKAFSALLVAISLHYHCHRMQLVVRLTIIEGLLIKAPTTGFAGNLTMATGLVRPWASRRISAAVQAGLLNSHHFANLSGTA